MTGSEPAFPLAIDKDSIEWHFGMTRRELFAAMAMQGMCANEGYAIKTYHDAAEMAVCQADALIAELAKEQK